MSVPKPTLGPLFRRGRQKETEGERGQQGPLYPRCERATPEGAGTDPMDPSRGKYSGNCAQGAHISILEWTCATSLIAQQLWKG